METILTNLITSIIGGVDNTINVAFNSLMDLCFNAEYTLTHNFGIAVLSFENLKTVITSFAICLIILKFLKKGFDIYILWTEGESDTPPLTFIMYFIRAIVVLLSATILWDWVVEIIKSFGTSLLNAMSFSTTFTLTTAIVNFVTGGIFNAIIGLVAIILYFVLYIQFIMRGLEIWILKIGFPIACVGLVQADGGGFNSYFEKILKSMITVVVQIILCKLSMMLIASSQFLYTIAAIILALKTPRFLQDIMMVSGGGIGSAINTTSKTMELSGQIKRKIAQFKKVK